MFLKNEKLLQYSKSGFFKDVFSAGIEWTLFFHCFMVLSFPIYEQTKIREHFHSVAIILIYKAKYVIERFLFEKRKS